MVNVKLARYITREVREKKLLWSRTNNRSLRTKDILKEFRCLCFHTAVDHVVAVWWVQLHFVKGSTRKVGKKKRDKPRRGKIKTTLNQPGICLAWWSHINIAIFCIWEHSPKTEWEKHGEHSVVNGMILHHNWKVNLCFFGSISKPTTNLCLFPPMMLLQKETIRDGGSTAQHTV